MAESAKVVITTVGPYIHYGEPVVAACAAAGTHYVDLTGEPEFVDLMWLRHHEQAQRTGARLVHSCGFDSIPYDLGALYTVNASCPRACRSSSRASSASAAPSRAAPCTRRSTSWPGCARAGRWRAQRTALETRPDGRSVHGHHRATAPRRAPPVAGPSRHRRSIRSPSCARPGPWTATGPTSATATTSSPSTCRWRPGSPPASAAWSPWRSCRRRARRCSKLKDPGEGPNPEQRAKAWFNVRFRGEGGGRRVVTEVSGGDPGYGETSKMLAEAALCLAHDDLPERAGQLTPRWRWARRSSTASSSPASALPRSPTSPAA